MKKLVLLLLLVSGGFTMMSLAPQERRTETISDGGGDGTRIKRCRRSAGNGPPFWKRHCHDCSTHFSNYSTRGNCSG